MATGHVVRRGRSPEAMRGASYRFSRKLQKRCPHSRCNVVITDTAHTCAEHMQWWRRIGQGKDEQRRHRRHLFDLAFDQGVPVAAIALYARRWARRRWGMVEAAQIQELICGYIG